MKRRILNMAMLFIAFPFMSLPSIVNAQELPLLNEKQGTFQILSRTNYTSPDCGFTKTEITTNLQKITDVINTVRKNPILGENKGFDGRARIYNVDCKYKGSYGIPSRISFEFAAWYRLKDGKEERNLMEPPEWTMIINQIMPIGNGFSSALFDRESGIFSVPLKKETPEPGIDVYDGECFVIYDPSRPPYWIPVTVDEAFTAVKKANEKETDRTSADYLKEYIDREYAEMPVSDRDKPAYFGGNVSRVSSSPSIEGSDNSFPALMRVNPEYWNKNLPKSTIQFIYFRSVTNKKYLKQLKEEYLHNNSISYHEMRFQESFGMDDIRNLVPLIGK